jgi:hypothetical protein
MTAFDPIAWLEAFTAADGTYAIGANDRLWLSTFDIADGIDAHTEQLAGHPEWVEAIKGIVRERCLIC